MNRVFKIQIIQPNFDKLYKKYEQMFAGNQKKESEPVAIKVSGKLSGSKIDNNISIGMRLLEADEIEKSSVRGNKVFLHGEKSKASVENKEEKEGFLSKFFWFFVVTLLVVVIGGLILYYGFGIK